MPSKTYALFTETGREQRLVDVLTNTIQFSTPDAADRIYVPYRAKLMRDRDENGKLIWTEVRDILMPRCCFVESSDIELFYSLLYKPQIDMLYALLGKGTECTIYPVTNDDLERLERLMNGSDYAEASRGTKTGSTIRFTSGPLVGREAEVSFIDTHRKFALLKMMFLGEMRDVKLAVDIVYDRTETVTSPPSSPACAASSAPPDVSKSK